MPVTTQLNVPARLVLAHATFTDPSKPDATVFDVVYRHPDFPGRLVADGMRVLLAGTIPLALSSEEGGQLEGLPYGDAVIHALDRDARAALFEHQGKALANLELSDLKAPLFGLAMRGEVVIAGVASPPSPDPVYVPFSPAMLCHWEFTPGLDTATPRIPAALSFVSVRVFTPEAWGRIAASGRRLKRRPLLQAGAEAPMHIQEASRTECWMQEHVTKPKQWKRDAALKDCMTDTGCTYREALAGWNALSDELRGKRGKRK